MEIGLRDVVVQAVFHKDSHMDIETAPVMHDGQIRFKEQLSVGERTSPWWTGAFFGA